MKAEQAKKIADQALEQLAKALAAGRSEELTRYLSMLAKFHKYSFVNVMLILSQMPDATHVAGFNTWKQVGRYVRHIENKSKLFALSTTPLGCLNGLLSFFKPTSATTHRERARAQRASLLRVFSGRHSQ